MDGCLWTEDHNFCNEYETYRVFLIMDGCLWMEDHVFCNEYEIYRVTW